MIPDSLVPFSWSDFFSWHTMFPGLFLALAGGYLLGSIPFGLLLTKAAGLGDIRSIGSGNIGTTNVLRTGRKDLAIATLLLDAIKGTLAVFIAARWGIAPAFAAGLGAFAGHVFPIWLRFRGGKGVATYVGIVAAFSWPAALFFAGLWSAVAVLTRYSSLSSLVTTFATPILMAMAGRRSEAVFFAVLSVVVWIKHSANIRRLMAGSENRIGGKA